MKRMLLTALLSVAATCAVAAEEPDSTQPVSAAQAFVTKATQDGLAEIQLGQTVQQRTKDPKVKEFAARMVADHTKANAELAAIAKRKNLEVPTDLDDKHATMAHAVSTKPPSEFDGEYAKKMREAHDNAITLFTDASAVGDKEIAAFAKKTLATLKQHQQMAAMLPAKPAGSTSAAGTAQETPPEP